MSGGIDVLAVLADAARYETKAGASPAWIAELTAARAAVAELIEAGKAYDTAMRGEADTDGMLIRESARARLRAALAQVQS